MKYLLLILLAGCGPYVPQDRCTTLVSPRYTKEYVTCANNGVMIGTNTDGTLQCGDIVITCPISTK